jgi:hypothetical protein
MDFADAAAPGAVAATSSSAQRVLVVLQQSGTCREIIVGSESVLEDTELFDQLLHRALHSVDVFTSNLVERAIGNARFHIRQYRPVLGEPQPHLIASAIQRAILKLGVFAPAELIAMAESLLPLLPGYLGQAGVHLSLLRRAQSAADVAHALTEIRLACTEKCEVAEGEWQLIAAIACD